MIAKSGATILDGRSVGTGGTVFVPIDKDSSSAMYRRESGSYGVVYEGNSDGKPYIAVRPPWQLPPFARDKDGFGRLMFELPGIDAMKLSMDHRDGEIIYKMHGEHFDDAEHVATAVDEALEYLEKEVYPAVLKLVVDASEQME